MKMIRSHGWNGNMHVAKLEMGICETRKQTPKIGLVAVEARCARVVDQQMWMKITDVDVIVDEDLQM